MINSVAIYPKSRICRNKRVNEGDTVIAENPSFIGALNAFRSLGANLVGVDMEEDGINLAALEETLKNTPNAKLLYLIPTFHNPCGTCMSYEKRVAVLALAKKYDVIIIEDNPYGELRFAGEEIPTIKSMDDEGRVIYCGSFSKILSAGMRVGFLCAHEDLVAKIVVAKQVEDVHTNQFFQMVCSRFIDECDLDGHIAKIRALYGRKCALMLSEMDKHFPKDKVVYTRPEGGLFIWCTLPDEVDASGASPVVGVAYRTGHFNTKALIVADGYTMTAADKEELRKGGILLSEMQ